MIFRSVVGKLWMIMIILVSLVLILLNLFLSERVEKKFVHDQEASLDSLAEEMQSVLSNDDIDKKMYLERIQSISQSFGAEMVVISEEETDLPLQTDSLPSEFSNKIDLSQVLNGEKQKVVQPFKTGEEKMRENHYIIAIPYLENQETKGAILLYTQNLYGSSNLKHWIFYSALIGITLTTILAFYLSSRINRPLVEMQQAAEKMAKGEFSTRVHIRSREKDEIANLAIAFNRMAGQLEDSIHLLSHEKEQLTSILRSMTDGVITMNAYGKVILSNPHADRFLELCRDRSTPVGIKRLPPSMQSIFQQVVKDEKEAQQDITEQGRTWAVVMAPLYARNQVRGAVAVLRDVTDERLLEKFRKDFVANVSHELRTPLSMLQGYSEALLDDIADTPEARRELAQIINDESMRMSRLVKELLDLARMEAGFIELKRDELPVDLFVERVVHKFQNLAREKKVSVQEEIVEELPLVHWDEDKMEQVLTNLISNAIRHTPEGGAVKVKAFVEGGHVYLEVEDTGTGIPEEDLPFVFERFFKADKARKRGKKSGGTGLGLSIVKHIVTAHRGNVSVRSQVGQGTVFSTQLPIHSGKKEEEEE